MTSTGTTATMSEDDVFTRIGETPVGPLQLRVIAIALVLNMLDGFDVTALSFTAHGIGEQLGLAPDQLGIVFSVTLAGMMLGAMFLASLSDLFGRRSTLLGCVSVIGLSVVLTGFAGSLAHLIVLRLITGLGVGAMLASLTALTSEFTPRRYRSFTIGIVTAGFPLGATVGGFLVAPLLPEYGWRAIFIGGGLLTLAMLAPLYWWTPESVQFLARRRPVNALGRINATLTKMRLAPLPALPDARDQAPPASASVVSLLTPQYRRRTLMLWITLFFCFICLYFLMSWIPKLVIDAGLSESLGVYASVAFNGGGVLGVLLLGWFAAQLGLSRLIGLFLAGGAGVMVLFALLFAWMPLLATLMLVGFLLQGGFVGLYSVAAKLYPAEFRATGVGWAIGLGRFGAVVGPWVGGLLIAAGYSIQSNFLVFAVPLLISGLLAFRLDLR